MLSQAWQWVLHNPGAWFPIAYVGLSAFFNALKAKGPKGGRCEMICDIALAFLANLHAFKSDGPGVPPGAQGGSNVVPYGKAIILALAGLAAALPGHSWAGPGLDWSTGPSLPAIKYDLGGVAHTPGQVAPGLGWQLAVTHDALKKELAGRSWDMLDLNLIGFGSLLSKPGGEQFGQLSAAVGLSTLSSLIGVAVGLPLLMTDQAFAKGPPFLLLTVQFNFAIAPTAPPIGFAKGPAGLPRGNTLYLMP